MNRPTPFDQYKPRYVLLAEEIARAIGDGVYPVGSLMPTEPELCAKHDVSRHTVREAVRMLREMGLVQSRQGQGTRILSAQIPSRYVLTMDAIPDLWQYVEHSELTVNGMRTVAASEALTPLPGASAEDQWCLVEATRRVEPGAPIAWKHVYIISEYRDVIGDIGRLHIPIYSLIEARHGIRTVRVRQELSAATIPDAAADALNLERGATGLEIVRHYHDSRDRVFEVTMTIYPPNRFRYSADLMLTNGTK